MFCQRHHHKVVFFARGSRNKHEKVRTQNAFISIRCFGIALSCSIRLLSQNLSRDEENTLSLSLRKRRKKRHFSLSLSHKNAPTSCTRKSATALRACRFPPAFPLGLRIDDILGDVGVVVVWSPICMTTMTAARVSSCSFSLSLLSIFESY